MNCSKLPHVDFEECLRELDLPNGASADFWEYQPDSGRQISDVVKATQRALQAPVDYPPLEMTIVDGDTVALAVDPNLPQLVEIVVGIVTTIASTDAARINVVLGDEATDSTLDSVTKALATAALATAIPRSSEKVDYIKVTRHDCVDREALRYLGADADALPWYINRQLVDADVVVPIATRRPMLKSPAQPNQLIDFTGVFPAFADSATRSRFRTSRADENEPEKNSPEVQIPWLLGVQLMVVVGANHAGRVREIVAGMPHSLANQQPTIDEESDGFPPSAMLVIASTDGDAQQQTWANAARAALAAIRYVEPGGTVLVWTDMDVPPGDAIRRILEANDESQWWEPSPTSHQDESESLPAWDESVGIGISLSRVLAENRLVIRSRVNREQIESLGLGSLDSIDELKRIVGSFGSCGVLRGAQYLADAIAAMHRLDSQP